MSYMPCFDLIILPYLRRDIWFNCCRGYDDEVPVIGSNAGGVPEIINHQENGLFESKTIQIFKIKLIL